MLTKFYRKSTSPASTGIMITGKTGVIANVVIMNDSTTESNVRLYLDNGMVFFDKTLAPKAQEVIVLDTLVNDTEVLKVYTGVAEMHTLINFLERA